MNNNKELSKLSGFRLYFEKLEDEPKLMRGVGQRLRRLREATLKRREERAKDTKQTKK